MNADSAVMATSDIPAQLQQALAGDDAVLGTLLERYRSYLRILPRGNWIPS